MSEAQPSLTLTLPAQDWQLLMSICQQSLQPYQRLAQVLQTMQQQAAEAQVQNRGTLERHEQPQRDQQAESRLNNTILRREDAR